MRTLDPGTQQQNGHSASGTAASIVLALGMIATSTLYVPGSTSDPERFAQPKELALHVAAFVAAAILLPRLRTVRVTTLDGWIGVFAALSIVSASLATNWLFALRVLSLTTSAAFVF